jgi:hypothetical protein
MRKVIFHTFQPLSRLEHGVRTPVETPRQRLQSRQVNISCLNHLPQESGSRQSHESGTIFRSSDFALSRTRRIAFTRGLGPPKGTVDESKSFIPHQGFIGLSPQIAR